MPITVGLLYREYERLLRAGSLQLEGYGCPRPGVPGGRRADEADRIDGFAWPCPSGVCRQGRMESQPPLADHHPWPTEPPEPAPC